MKKIQFNLQIKLIKIINKNLLGILQKRKIKIKNWTKIKFLLIGMNVKQKKTNS